MTSARVDHAVEALYDDYSNLEADLQASPSGLSALNRSYHKQLLLASASSLENDIKELVSEIFESNGGRPMAEFVKSRVMARGYHTLFDWPRRSARGFFGSFGDDCRERFSAALHDNPDLKDQTDAFLLLGDMRNNLVHNNYAIVQIDMTPREIIRKYRLAICFIGRIESIIFPVPLDHEA